MNLLELNIVSGAGLDCFHFFVELNRHFFDFTG